jgi:hypothetical protein
MHHKRKHHGYHGGATPQEMVCPLILLTDRSNVHFGLYESAYSKPEWWSSTPISVPVQSDSIARKVRKGQLSLFDQVGPNTDSASTLDPRQRTNGWINTFLESAAYREQKQKIMRHSLDDSTVRASLEALASNGGIMTPLAFARATGILPARLDGMVAKLQRILNVDGYEILTFERNENKVELNVAKLKRQFDLD